ncbi:hypothetical protein [Caenimonas sp. SL110]|uniref:hypothetical protein n=1 Tax=Caenimonas sp. SL110 TaxID=1450524 RepID=UPI001379380A|nr:hypothetical protein [Caenimonas sp. SL110]
MSFTIRHTYGSTPFSQIMSGFQGLTPQSLRDAVTGKDRTLVYSFGCDRSAGFGADYLGFVGKLMWCLQNDVGFRFGEVRRPVGFITARGWTDYFEPFCEEARGPLLDKLNVHAFPYARRLPFLKTFAGAWLRATVQPASDYFSFDALDQVTGQGQRGIAANDFLKDRQALIEVLWRYNAQTLREVRQIKEQANLLPESSSYFAICVRRGDKLMEHGYVGVQRYVQAIAQHAGSLRTLFLATDDASVVDEVRKALPDFNVLTLTDPASKGYVHRDFSSLPASERRRQTLRFFAQLELMRDARFFIGSRTTNVSWMANALRGGDGVHWVD